MRRKKKEKPVLGIPKGKRFFPLMTDMLMSQEYQSLRSTEKALLNDIFARYNGRNGTLINPITCLYKHVNLKSTTMSKAIRSLEEKGWIYCDSVGGRMKNANKYYFGPKLRNFYT